MTLALNKYKNLRTKENWLAKSQEEQQTVTLSSELEKTKDTNIKLENYSNKRYTKWKYQQASQSKREQDPPPPHA